MGVESEPGGLSNPFVECNIPCYFLDQPALNYDFKNGTYDVVPGNAESYEVLDDGLRYRLTLRQNAYFHDGTPYNAEAMVYYVQMELDPAHPLHNLNPSWRGLPRLGSVERVEAVSDYVVDFYMSALNPAQLDWFTDNAYAPHSPQALEERREEIVNNPAGLGAYKFVEWQKGSRLVVERFDRFYDPEIGVAPQIIFRATPEKTALVAALEAGEVHWMEGVPPLEAARLREVDNVVVRERKTLYVWFISLDVRKPPLDDVRVRQALNYAVDKDSLIRDVLSGAGERSYSPLSPQFGDFYVGDRVTHYDYNPQKAKDLLAEAGFPNGFDEIDGQRAILYASTPRTGQQMPVEMASFIQANWRDVGVNVDIEVIEWGAFESRRVKGEFPMATRGWTPSTSDPDGVLLQNFHGDWRPPNGRNVTYLNDPEVNDLLTRANQTVDHNLRVQLFGEAQQRIVDLAPWVFIDHEIAFEAHSAQLQGYAVFPGGRGPGMNYAWLEG